MMSATAVATRRALPVTRKLILGCLVGVGLLWLSMRHLAPHRVLAAILSADIFWIAIALAFYAANLAVRVFRWRMLLHGYGNLSYRKVGAVLLAGYGMNFLLPARLGELFRIELLRRRHGVVRAIAFSGIAIERVLDGLCVVSLLGIGLWITGETNDHGNVLMFVNITGAAIFGGAVLGWIWFERRPPKRLLSRWPRVSEQFELMHQSFAAVNGSRLLQVIGLTGVVYANEAAALWAICHALGLSLGPPELLVLVGVSALSTLMPSAPGFVGTFQMAFVVTFSQYNQAPTLAVAAATLVQLVLFGPLIVAAVPTLLHGGLSFAANLRPSRAGGSEEASAESPPAATPAIAHIDFARPVIASVVLLVAVVASRNIIHDYPTQQYLTWWRLLSGLRSPGEGQAALHDLVTPNSGEYVLPSAVRDMLVLLRQHDVTEYALSPQISADPLLSTRIAESAFPRRLLPAAPDVLALLVEQLPANCKSLGVEREVQLAVCD